MQRWIGRQRRNRNIASARGKGLGVYVIAVIAICDSDITSGDRVGGGMGGRFNFE